MRRLALVAAVSGALATAGPAGAAPPVTLQGYAGITPGMSVSQVEERLGVDLRVDYLHPSCGTSGFGSGRLRGYALFQGPRLGSLWFERGVRTGRGIRIGSTVEELEHAYPGLRSRPDHYVPKARNYFLRRSQAPHWRFRFDVSPAGRVTGIAFGNATVFYIEGCA